jgi:VCBS repeat-containing protein
VPNKFLKLTQAVAISLCINYAQAEVYTFTNSGATGATGPTQSQVNTEYTGSNLSNSVVVNTQGIQEWIVPVSGTYEIEAWGAQGGSGGWYSNSSYSSTGGLGGYAKGSITLSAGTTIYILVGQQGEGFASNNIKMTESPGARAGGWNGGGGNSISSAPGTGGGGASDVRVGGIELSNRIIVAGGGGGGGNSKSNVQLSNGGNGGGLSSNTLQSSTQFSDRTPGTGATQNSGNALGIGETSNQNLSGGGGGGYYGGGSGDNSTGGGGGSSYLGGVSNGTTQSGIRSGHGKIVITRIQSTNSPPVISQGNSPISKSLNEDSSTTWASHELNATDSDTNASNLSWSIINQPANGSTTIDGNGTSPSLLSYQPNTNFFGSDSFTVQVSDGENNDSITFNLNINPVNDHPTLAGDFAATLAEDENATGDINATDPDGLTDGSYFTISSNPSNGSANINQLTGSWSYSPQANFFGSDSFSVSITDDLGNSTSQSISLSISPVNDLPIISGEITATLAEDENATGDINATDPDGLTDGSYFTISSNPSNGSANINQLTGSWSYSPQANFFGSDSFSVSITDDLGNSTSQSISLSISPVNDLPIISGEITATLAEDENATGDINATDPDGLTDGSYFTISSDPSNGSANINQLTGSWSYSPQANFFGSDSFSVSITDDLGNSTSQSISLSISPVNDLPIISGEITATLAEDENATGDINATDPDGLTDGSYFTISSNPSNGSVNINQLTGSWSYTPQANFFGSDSFSVSITDDLGNSTSQSISLSISPVNDPPYNLMLNNNQLFENLAPNTSVGTFSAEDLESNNSIIFSMIDGNGSNHNHLFSIESNGTLKTSSILDFESNESLLIHVKARDTNNSSIEKTFRINVLNIVEDFDNDGIEDYFDSDDDNDSYSDAIEIAYGSDPLNPNSVANKAPNKISISNNTFYESQPVGLFIGKLSATDPDINSTHSFSFIDRNNSTHNQLFEIDTNHSLRTNSLFKFSNEKDYFIIRVNAKDEHNASYAQELYIRIIKDENQSIRLGNPDVFIDAIGRVSFSTPIILDNNSHLKFKPSYEEWVKGGQNIPEELVFLGGSPWFNEETGENRSSTEVYNMIFGDNNTMLPEFNYLFSKHSDFSTIALSRPQFW